MEPTSASKNPLSKWEHFKKNPFEYVRIEFKMKMGIMISTQHVVVGGWEVLAESLGFSNDDIARIRLEGQKPDKYVGCILLDEFGRRGRCSTVQVLEEQLKIFGRQDVLNILYESANVVCQLTCTVKLNGHGMLELSQSQVNEDKTLYQALEEDLKKNNLKKDELEFEQIPVLRDGITWDTAVGKLKGRHLIIQQRKQVNPKNLPKNFVSPAVTSSGKLPKGIQESTDKIPIHGKPVLEKTEHPESEVKWKSGFDSLSLDSNDDDDKYPVFMTNQSYSLSRNDRFPSERYTQPSSQQSGGSGGTRRQIISYPSSNVPQYEPECGAGKSCSYTSPIQCDHCKSLSSSLASPISQQGNLATDCAHSNACTTSSGCCDVSLLPGPNAEQPETSAVCLSHTPSFPTNVQMKGIPGVKVHQSHHMATDVDLVEASGLPGWHPSLTNDSHVIHRVMKNYYKADGYYVLRPLKDGRLAISVTYMGKVKHFHFYKNSEGWYMFRNDPKMASLDQLIDWYKTRGIPVKHEDHETRLLRLRCPIMCDQNVEEHVYFA